MYKLLLTLVTLSTGVFCNGEQNLTDTINLSLDDMKTVNSRETRATTDSVPSIVNMNGHFNYHAGQQVFFVNGPPDMLHKGTKGCMSYLQRDDYVVTVGIGAHKLHKRKMKWNQARKSCMDEGGLLVIINSVEEEALLMNWAKREKVESTWLGVHDQFEEGDWVTLTGQTLDAAGYDKWSTVWPNQPDNYGGRQNCGVLTKEGGIDDIECDLSFPYFCEINLC